MLVVAADIRLSVKFYSSLVFHVHSTDAMHDLNLYSCDVCMIYILKCNETSDILKRIAQLHVTAGFTLGKSFYKWFYIALLE